MSAIPLPRRFLLPVSLGVADGIVNALILASSSVLHGRHLAVPLAFRVGAVALVTAVFTVFVAEYAQLRSDLARAEHQLSLARSGQFAASNLGRQVVKEASAAAIVASLCSFAGAATPLLVGTVVRRYAWSGLAVAVIALGVLGGALAIAVGGRPLRWIVALVVMGCVVTVIGVSLNIA